ncbi:MAG: hypothetical protein AAFR21_16520 [Pseudomonadota bacterium]
MELTLQIFVGLATAMLLGLGTMSMSARRRIVKNSAIEPIGTVGVSAIRPVIGGLFIASVAMLAFGLVTGQTLGFLAVALVTGVVAIERVVGIVTDGFDKRVVPRLRFERLLKRQTATKRSKRSFRDTPFLPNSKEETALDLGWPSTPCCNAGRA